MKAKQFVFVVVGLIFCNCMYSQTITEKLKQFYKSADMDCYIAEIQENVNRYFVLDNANWGRDKYGILPEKVVLDKKKVIPMLTIQFVNTDSFTFKGNIYDHIIIDSSIVFTLACVDKRKNVKAFANFFDGRYVKLNSNFFSERKLKRVIKNINKQNPELILFCDVIIGAVHNSDGFLYIKNGKIFVYRLEKKDTYELNDYLHTFFLLSSVRDFNNVRVPYIYQDDNNKYKRAGNTPKEQIMKCLY